MQTCLCASVQCFVCRPAAHEMCVCVTDAFSADAQAELDQLNEAFKIEIKNAHFFLGNNIDVVAQVSAP